MTEINMTAMETALVAAQLAPQYGIATTRDSTISWQGAPPEPAVIDATLLAVRSTMLTGAVRRECERRINAALGSPTLQASMDRERGVLNKLHAKGVPLTPEQQAEEVLLDLINDWETAMIAIRESLIAAADPTFAADGHWYAPPEGLAARILASF